MMNSAGLSSDIQSKLEASGFNIIAQNTALCDAIASAVVEHIQANAETETIVAGGSSAGTYAGTVS